MVKTYASRQSSNWSSSAIVPSNLFQRSSGDLVLSSASTPTIIIHVWFQERAPLSVNARNKFRLNAKNSNFKNSLLNRFCNIDGADWTIFQYPFQDASFPSVDHVAMQTISSCVLLSCQLC